MSNNYYMNKKIHKKWVEEWDIICKRLRKSGYDLSHIVITGEGCEYYESERILEASCKN